MQKLTKQKNTYKSMKSVKVSKLLQSVRPNLPPFKLKTPNNHTNKNTLKKFKSIPNITYRDETNSQQPSEIMNGNVTVRPCINHSQIQLNIIPSISQRYNSKTKQSILYKLTSNKSPIKQYNLEILLMRAQTVLEEYKQRQNLWINEKKKLIAQLERYKRKVNSIQSKSYISSASTHNSHRIG